MMTSVLFVLLTVLVFAPIIMSSAFADNTWTVFLNQYDGLSHKELFSPIELPIKSGDVVSWRNFDSTSHKIVSGVPAHPESSGEFFSTDILSPGQSQSVKLEHTDYVGYYYFCEIHPWFTGKIFFEEFSPYNSTLNMTSIINTDRTLEVKGYVESDYGTLPYGLLIYDSKNNLIFHTVKSFNKDANFDVQVDVNRSVWAHDTDYILKLVYGVPSESTSKSIQIPIVINEKLQKNSIELCKNMANKNTNFIFEGISIPNWYKNSLCWFGNNQISSHEVSDALDYFTHHEI